MEWYLLDEKIKFWLAEDMPYGDVTSDPLFPDSHQSTGTFVAKEDGCVAGLLVAQRVFKVLSDHVTMTVLVEEGDRVTKGTPIAKISGRTRDILKGERLALNLMQRMSGIATMTRTYADKLEGTGTRIVDTRKTLPGLRIAQKYAVRCGGGGNHRLALWDAILIKENHIHAAGGIPQAMAAARLAADLAGDRCKFIQVEVESLDELHTALAAGATMILLDNFTLDMMREATAINTGQAVLEASGNVSLETIRGIAETGVDRISVGALTKDVKALDLSMRFTD